jgi:2'-5' RNA ligase
VTALRSALVVPVSEASEAVDAWLERTATAKPSAGIPAHITIVFPFVPARSIDDELIANLRAIFGRFEAFAFIAVRALRFPAVLYLAPEPPEPFVALTEAVISSYPQYPPYEGEFDTIVPHLTAAEGDPAVLAAAEVEIQQFLPVQALAREVTLLEEIEPDSGRWQVRETFRLGA